MAKNQEKTPVTVTYTRTKSKRYNGKGRGPQTCVACKKHGLNVPRRGHKCPYRKAVEVVRLGKEDFNNFYQKISSIEMRRRGDRQSVRSKLAYGCGDCGFPKRHPEHKDICPGKLCKDQKKIIDSLVERKSRPKDIASVYEIDEDPSKNDDSLSLVSEETEHVAILEGGSSDDAASVAGFTGPSPVALLANSGLFNIFDVTLEESEETELLLNEPLDDLSDLFVSDSDEPRGVLGGMSSIDKDSDVLNGADDIHDKMMTELFLSDIVSA